jgi:hypothetical protein
MPPEPELSARMHLASGKLMIVALPSGFGAARDAAARPFALGRNWA